MTSHDSIAPTGADGTLDEDVGIDDDAHDGIVQGRIARARERLATFPAAVDGSGGRSQTWSACRVALGFLLDPDTAATVLLEVYNPRCQPPWDETELREICNRASGQKPKRPESSTLSAETLDAAYRCVLERLPLHNEHEQSLLARGLTKKEIETLGYRTWMHSVERWNRIISDVRSAIGEENLFKVPGIVRPESPEFSIRGEGIAVPVRNIDGLIVGIRIRQERQVFKKKGGMPALNSDGSLNIAKKYIWLSWRKDHPEDARVRQAAHVPVHVSDLELDTVRLTEGEIKADLATLRTGVLTISVPGVGSWRLGVDVVVNLKARRVLIAFDSDCGKNRDVAGAIIHLEGELTKVGINVAIETWPKDAGKGIDDVIHAGHADKIRVLEGDEAKEWLDDLARVHHLPGRDLRTTLQLLEDGGLFEEQLLASANGEIAEAALETGTQPSNVVPLRLVGNTEPTARPQRPPLTDLGNAERLVTRHGRDILFCTLWNKWLCWDGSRWRIDDTQQVERLACETVRQIYVEASTEDDPETRRAIVRHAASSESAYHVAAMLRLAQTLVAVRPDCFDTDGWLLNVRNGTLDLKTGRLREHRRDDFITMLAPVEFDPAADRILVDTFLAKVQPNPEMRAYLWRRWGYALTGDTSEHFLAIDYGGGRNGKSTADNAIQKVLGDYAVQVPTELLLDRPGAHPTDRTTLHGKRFAVATETEEGARLNVSLIKQLTGGDPISARRMREDFWTFLPTHKLTLVTNHKPQIRETKDAIWRRVHLIPWAVQIPEGEEDKTLSARLPGPGLLRALVEGCLDYQSKKSLLPPKAVTAATQAYRAESDLLGGFIEEHLVADPKAQFEFRALYSLYKTWVEEGGHKRFSEKRLTGELDERGLGESVRSTTTGRMVRVGVKQRLEVSPDDDDGPWPENNPSILQPKPPPNKQDSCGTEGSEGSEGRSDINSHIQPREGEIPELPSDPSILQAIVEPGALGAGTCTSGGAAVTGVTSENGVRKLISNSLNSLLDDDDLDHLTEIFSICARSTHDTHDTHDTAENTPEAVPRPAAEKAGVTGDTSLPGLLGRHSVTLHRVLQRVEHRTIVFECQTAAHESVTVVVPDDKVFLPECLARFGWGGGFDAEGWHTGFTEKEFQVDVYDYILGRWRAVLVEESQRVA